MLFQIGSLSYFLGVAAAAACRPSRASSASPVHATSSSVASSSISSLASATSSSIATSAPPAQGCQAPWVIAGKSVYDALPSSEGSRLCSSVLGKYQTTTQTVTVTIGTTTQFQYEFLPTTVPTPFTSLTSPIFETSDITRNVTIPYTLSTTTTETVTSTISDFTTVTLAASAIARRGISRRDGANDANSQIASAASLLSIPSSLVSDFCSCEAQGPTSISTVVETISALETATSTVTRYNATITPQAITQIVTSYTTTFVYETDTYTSTTTEILTEIDTATAITTVITTATPTVLSSFYLQVISTDATNGQCAFWESEQGNVLEFAGSSGNVLTKPPALFSFDPTTGWLSSGGLVAGTLNTSCSIDCSELFIRLYAASLYSSSGYTPLVCSYDGSDGGTVTCGYSVTVNGRTTKLSIPAFQVQQDEPSEPGIANQESLFYTPRGTSSINLRAVANLNECSGYTV